MNQSDRKIRWGIIGCGDVTEVKSGPGFQRARNSSLVAVMRRNPDLARDYASRHQVSKWYIDAEDLIDDEEVDAIYIATPPAFHKEYTFKAAMAKKPVYVEKPMAMNYLECLQMIEICREKQVPLFVAYYRRALPKFLKIKEMIDLGLLGEIRFVNMQLYMPPLPQDYDYQKDRWWRTDPGISGGGYFYDMASHMIDLLFFFFGKIRDLFGNFSNQAKLYPVEDIVSAEFVFESGVHGTGLWCFTSGIKEDRTQIVGSKGMVSFDILGSGPIKMEIDGQKSELPFAPPMHIQEPLIQTIVDELLGVGKCPSSGDSGAMTNWFIDQIFKKKS